MASFDANEDVDIPLEVLTVILQHWMDIRPESRPGIARLNRYLRKQFYLPHSARVHGGFQNYPDCTPTPTHFSVAAEEVSRFTEDVESFTNVFSPPSEGIAFGQLQNVEIILPMDADHLLALVRALAKLPGLQQLKITGAGESIDVDDYLRDVGLVIIHIRNMAVLCLNLTVEDEPEELPSYTKWHEPAFFNSLSALENLTVLKIRTGYALHPHRRGDDDQRTAGAIERARLTSQTHWHRRLIQYVPSLMQVHTHDSYLSFYETRDQYSEGARKLWYKTGGRWEQTLWHYPTPAGSKVFRRARVPPGRSTRKVAFDAWESDEEYASTDEYGWER